MSATQTGSQWVKVIEAIRILGTGAGFYWIYDQQGLGHEVEALRFLVLTLALALCATCAAEGIFVSESSAREKGYRAEGERKSPYQIQNLAWFVAATVTGVWLFQAESNDAGALLGYAVFVLLFFGLSALNHGYQTVRFGNMTWQNLNRPVLFGFLIVASIPIIAPLF